MSGSKLLAFREREQASPLEASLRIEDDARLARFTAAGSLCGLAFAGWAATATLDVIPRDLGPTGPGFVDVWPLPRDPGPILVKPPEDYHRKLRPPQVARHHDRNGATGRQAPAPKTAHPAEKSGWLGQNVVTSRNGRNDLGAYDLIGKAARGIDLDKLTELPVLKRTPHSGIGGRRGKEGHEFNLEYYEDGEGGDGGREPVMPHWERPEGPAATRPGRLPPGPRITSIEYAQESNARSTESILAVIKSHSPGLRHVYNGFLKQRPGLAGKIQLRFAIAPGGDIVEMAVASSTTAAPDFDAAVAAQIRSWRFEAVKGPGNDQVTVPFTFSE